MPPRLCSSRRLSVSLSSSQSISLPRSSIVLSSSSFSPSTPSTSQSRLQSTAEGGGQKPRAEKLAARKLAVEKWLAGPGAVFKRPLPGSTNYLSAYDKKTGQLLRAKGRSEEGSEKKKDGEEAGEDASKGEKKLADIPPEDPEDLRPFPLNPDFISQPILSEDLRNEIYRQVKEEGKSVRAVSVMYSVDMRRVGAVVRLVELERRMRKAAVPLASPYNHAIHQMVPTTPLPEKGKPPVRHESINDLPVHRLTQTQIFYPVSESRQFNRVDAGRVFSAAPGLPHEAENEKHNTPEAIARVTQHPYNIEILGKPNNEEQVLQPADVRIPHPHLVAFEHDKLNMPNEKQEQVERFNARLQAEEDAAKARKERRRQKIEAMTERVVPEDSRFEFRFKDVVVSREGTGLNGRGTKAPGRRYGVPHDDRKRGVVKIPTRVSA